MLSISDVGTKSVSVGTWDLSKLHSEGVEEGEGEDDEGEEEEEEGRGGTSIRGTPE